ncbi:glycosyltransferase [Actinoplanes sp. NPDC051411]|uniref:glycosyltransferase n=1 Tax=Actinoplanes sp. NPDC051411 TaxID=3155522 RepID=UPI00342CDEBE
MASPVPVLFLLADTGSGHRAAATAVQQALERGFPGAFTPIFCDPLSGPEAHPWVRRLVTLYGPTVRRAPWLWSMLYHGTDRHPIASLLGWLVRTFAGRPVRQAVTRHGPRLLVSFHPLLGGCVADVRRVTGTRAMTVVTDLVTGHCSWRRNDADVVVVPSRAMQAWYRRAGSAGNRCVDLGLPVAAAFGAGPLPDAARRRLRRRLGLGGSRFVVVLTGGGEGAAKLGRQARALVRRLPDIDVVAICGRNERVRRSLERFALRTGARLTVRAYVDNMADWVRSADVLVTKAGPGTIAEATCCATPLLITWHVPGQERGNAEVLVAAGAGRRVRGIQHLLREVRDLRLDPGAVAAMRAASARLARPEAADDIAVLIARLATTAPSIEEEIKCEV